MENNLIMEKRILFTTIIASIMLCACAKEIKTVADDVSVEKVSTATTEETASEESSETSDTSEKCIADYNSYDELIGDIKKYWIYMRLLILILFLIKQSSMDGLRVLYAGHLMQPTNWGIYKWILTETEWMSYFWELMDRKKIRMM